MVKQIQGAYKVKSPGLKPLYDEARKRIARLEAFEITHALRHKNKDADRLANQAMDRGMGRDRRPNGQRLCPHTIAKRRLPFPIQLVYSSIIGNHSSKFRAISTAQIGFPVKIPCNG